MLRLSKFTRPGFPTAPYRRSQRSRGWEASRLEHTIEFFADDQISRDQRRGGPDSTESLARSGSRREQKGFREIGLSHGDSSSR